ncbi:MAG TPA: flagellar hook-length control protein FliK [Acidobacteriota bacterium]|nr:flagellar hook-length control protein FliK [Acidobacteriota bacterium]
MMQPGVNILDMLLGTADQRGTARPSDAVGTTALTGPAFGDVLGLLVADPEQPFGPFGTDIGPGASGTASVDENSPTGALLSMDMAGVARLSNSLTAGIPDVFSVPPASARPPAVTENAMSVAWPGQSALDNLTLRELVILQRMNLSPGTYDIADWHLGDDRIDLQLKPHGLDTGQIRLSLPAELLKAAAEGRLNTSNGRAELLSPARVDLHAAGPTTPRFNDLIANLNLKSIEISGPVSEQTAQATGDSVTFKIVAENAGSEFVIRSRIARDKIDATVAEKRPVAFPADRQVLESGATAGAGKSAGQSADFGFGGQFGPDVPSGSNGRTATPFVRQQGWMNELNAIDRQDQPWATWETEGAPSADLSGGDAAAVRSGTVQARLSASQVRFTLPDDIGRVLSPDRHSVTIRIEPDHLGTARLHLALRGDSLNARVIVESFQAQAAVEGSLDQLREHLGRAGIKVDHIEVSVAGDGMRNQFSDRRTGWHRPVRFRPLGPDEAEAAEAAAGVPVMAAREAAYISQYGVNVLA